MDSKRIPLENEELKYKKKTKSKGQPRSKHKHEYIPVLLHTKRENPLTHKITVDKSVYKVCKICGRIDSYLSGDEWYDTDYGMHGTYLIGRSKLNKNALKLPKWHRYDFFDKFAYKED